jgi:hypothetical protein
MQGVNESDLGSGTAACNSFGQVGQRIYLFFCQVVEVTSGHGQVSLDVSDNGHGFGNGRGSLGVITSGHVNINSRFVARLDRLF